MAGGVTAGASPGPRRVGVRYEPEGIATIELCDIQANNALSEPLVEDLLAGLHQVVAWDALKVAVLLGSPEVFSSGASRAALHRFASGGPAPADLLVSKALLDVPVPLIAALEGHAIGGGLALGLCADIILIARESRYGCSFMNLGFTPGLGTTRLLEQVVSPMIAHEMLYTGTAFRGSHFEGRSGFNYILPRSLVRPTALDLARSIAEKSRVSLLALKRVLSLPKRLAFESTRTTETLMHQISFTQPDILHLIDESYVE